MIKSASEELGRLKSDEQLAVEIVEGRLNPSTHRGAGGLKKQPDDESLMSSIEMLLNSGIRSGTLRGLARGVLIAWEAGYDSDLLGQAEPKMVRKAKEIILERDMNAAIAARNRVQLHDCCKLANDLSLSEATFPLLAKALELSRELEEEARNMQDASRPAHNQLFGKVIEQFSHKVFGEDIYEIQRQVESESSVAKETMEKNMEKLETSLARLKGCLAMTTSSEKLTELKSLHDIFIQLNPKQLQMQVDALQDQVGDLLAENAQIRIKLHNLRDAPPPVPVASPQEIEALQERIAELEEAVLEREARVSRAGHMGAELMREKKDKEISELKETLTLSLRAQVESEFKRKSMELVQIERKTKVSALEGMEQALNKKHQMEIEQLRVGYETEIEELRAQLARRVQQQSKANRVLGS